MLLDLPFKWIKSWPQGQKQFSQQPGSLWFDFPALWGAVREAVMFQGRDPAVVHLLVHFASSEGAKTMFELLSDRYLYNPSADEDTFPVRCVLGHVPDLRQSTEGGSGAATGFELRCRSADPAVPQVIPITGRVTLGRDAEFAQAVLQKPHISKAHAVLELHNGRLSIQDTSVNGTWVNDRRVANGVRVELQPFDKVSFLPAANPVYKALVYEVWPSEARDAPPRPTRPARQVQAPREASRREEASDVRIIRGPTKRPRPHRHLAEPVVGGLERKRPRKVVQIEDDAGQVDEREDVVKWVQQLDGGSLVEYIPTLTARFDQVSQIKQYANRRLNEFFEDVRVKDPIHRLAFASALRALSKRSDVKFAACSWLVKRLAEIFFQERPPYAPRFNQPCSSGKTY